MPRYLVIQSARLGDLVQTRRLLLTLAFGGFRCLTVFLLLDFLSRFLDHAVQIRNLILL